MFPLSLRAHPYRARPQLHPRWTWLARFMPRQGIQRAPPDGLGCVRPACRGMPRSSGKGGAEGMDLRQHRGDEEAAAVDRAVARLVHASFATCDPSYYKHQQKLFNDFLRAGLAEAARSARSTGTRSTMTVLANEQVIDGPRLALWCRGRAGAEMKSMGPSRSRKYSQGAPGRARHAWDRWPDKVAADAAQLDRAVAKAC